MRLLLVEDNQALAEAICLGMKGSQVQKLL